MIRSAHFINRREGVGREGLMRVEGNRYSSCCWAISADEAKALVGGWIYLHESKGDRSAFGGLVDAVESADRLGTAKAEGFVIYFEARREAREQTWRGSSHAMVWWSGLVDADAPHEGAPGNA